MQNRQPHLIAGRKILPAFALGIALAGYVAAPALGQAASPELTIQINGKAKQRLLTGQPIDLTQLEECPGPGVCSAANRQKMAGTTLEGATAESIFSQLGREDVQYLQLPRAASVVITWPNGQDPPQATFWDFRDELVPSCFASSRTRSVWR